MFDFQALSLQNNFSAKRDDAGGLENDYLCPKPGQGLEVQGSYNDENFDYIKLSVKGCDQPDCADDTIVAAKQSIRVIIPESTVNYNSDTDEAVEWSL